MFACSPYEVNFIRLSNNSDELSDDNSNDVIDRLDFSCER